MLTQICVLAHLVGSISVVKSYKMDTDALLRTFQSYITDDKITKEKLDEAYAAKDRYGQPLPLPPRKLLLTEADIDKNEEFTVDELKSWKGYEGKAYCRNPGDAMYGCLDRCMGGVDSINGDPGFFDKYTTERDDYPDDDDMQINVHHKYTGGLSQAQRIVLKQAIRQTVRSKIQGDFVELGAKDIHSWRMIYDTLLNESDKTSQVHLYDPFTGFDACDHAKDTGMCPLPGTSAPNQIALQADISQFGDASRVKVHKVPFADIPASEFPNKIAFALIDGSLFNAVGAMLNSVAPHMAKGGAIFVHDFGWEGFPGVERAVQEFLKGKGSNMKVVLPGSADGVACYLGKIVA